MAKRQIPNLQFNINRDGEPDYSVIGQNEVVQDIVYSQTVWGIREAIKRKAKHAKIVEINSTGQYLTVDKQDFESALNKSILYYEKFEDYETCAEIIKLKNQL
jgi:inorganic pyrophosphatase